MITVKSNYNTPMNRMNKQNEYIQTENSNERVD